VNLIRIVVPLNYLENLRRIEQNYQDNIQQDTAFSSGNGWHRPMKWCE